MHPWKFVRTGGFDQVQFTSGADLVSLGALDQKLWVAVACPVKGLELDARTLELIDSDRDGRIRAPELVAASTWVGSLLRAPDDLMKSSASLPLASIVESSDEGRLLRTTAQAVLTSLGKPTATEVSVDDLMKAQKAFEAQPFNGDGVVPVESLRDDAAKAVAKDVIETQGSAPDRSGKVGFTAEARAAFATAITEHVAWLDKADADPATTPLREKTRAAHAALSAVRAKVDDFFARGRLVAFDARAVEAMNRDQKDYLAFADKTLAPGVGDVSAFPLARVAANAALPLKAGVNPAWLEAMATFATTVVEPLLGARDALTEADWATLTAKFSAHEAWLATKAGASVEKLGAARVRALANGDWHAAIDTALADEAAQKPVAEAITSLERLVRLHRDLLTLANNFVSFRDFYARRKPATFQVGTLLLDARACSLCIRVDDPAKHAALAPLARTYLVYCDLTRQASSEKMTIVAAMTAGDVDALMVGRNGLFYDRQGRDWDATVTKIIDAPISVEQAFWSPYKKLIRFIEEQIAKRAAAADAASNASLVTQATAVGTAAETGKHDEAKTPKKLDVGVVAALGVAVGGVTAALGGLLQAFFGLGMWMPLGVVGLVLFISGPSMGIAWLKLRQRNIGPLLEANGWAVNAQAKVNVPFGGSLTTQATLPPGSSRDLSDPFAERPLPWRAWLTLAVLLVLAGSWYLGTLDAYLPAAARSTSVLGDLAPRTPTP